MGSHRVRHALVTHTQTHMLFGRCDSVRSKSIFASIFDIVYI